MPSTTFSIETIFKYVDNPTLLKGPHQTGEIIMEEEEIRQLVKRVDAELRKLDKRMAKLRESRSNLIFTKNERKAWLRREPKFSKNIIQKAVA